MTKLLLVLTSFIAPVLTIAQDETVSEVVEVIETVAEVAPVYSFTGGGVFFMILAWTAIISWNAVCFTRILADKKED